MGIDDRAGDGTRLPHHDARCKTTLKCTQFGERLDGRGQRVCRGLLMHAVRRSQIVVGEELSDAFVGEQHRLFNQTGGGAAFARDDVNGNALVIQEHVDLGRLEVNRAALTTNLDAERRQARLRFRERR